MSDVCGNNSETSMSKVEHVDAANEKMGVESSPQSDDMMHLGDNVFAFVNTFQKNTRVLIRRYKSDGNGILHPTRDGVSLEPDEWSSLISSLRENLSRKLVEEPDFVFVVKKGVCVFNETVNGNICISVQKLFKSELEVYQLMSERVVLYESQIDKLCYVASCISRTVKEKLITYTLKKHILSEMEKKYPSVGGLSNFNKNTLYGVDELADSLRMCIFTELIRGMDVLSKKVCGDCKNGLIFHNGSHECESLTKSRKFDMFFDEVLYSVNWEVLAREFVALNVNGPYFKWIVCDLFNVINGKNLFENFVEFYLRC